MENSKDLGKKKVSDEDLGTVSGGCGKKKPDCMTVMKCYLCSFEVLWEGNYMDGKSYPCSVCGRGVMRGIQLKPIKQ